MPGVVAHACNPSPLSGRDNSVHVTVILERMAEPGWA